MTPFRIVLAAATFLVFQRLAGAEELTPSAFLRGDTPDEGVYLTMNAGVAYGGVILLDYADGWARIFYNASRVFGNNNKTGAGETWIQTSNISSIAFASSRDGVNEDEKRAAALELKKKLKEEAAARQRNLSATEKAWQEQELPPNLEGTPEAAEAAMFKATEEEAKAMAEQRNAEYAARENRDGAEKRLMQAEKALEAAHKKTESAVEQWKALTRENVKPEEDPAK